MFLVCNTFFKKNRHWPWLETHLRIKLYSDNKKWPLLILTIHALAHWPSSVVIQIIYIIWIGEIELC